MIKATNKLSEYSRWLYGRRYPTWVFDELSRYTMLIAWHKFDRYERQVIAEATNIDMSKLPFTPIQTVLELLQKTSEWSPRLRKFVHVAPLKSYRAKIVRAAVKHYNAEQLKKIRQSKRVRERIMEDR